MSPRTGDLRIIDSQPLVTPAALAQQLPLPDQSSAFIQRARSAIEAVLRGPDQRLLVNVGPCSIHDPLAVADYAAQLHEQTAPLAGSLLTVMRVYFEKPRTTVGWKGMINDPELDGSFHINRGLHLARKLLLDITATGLPVASEFLDTTFGQYYAELVSFGALGARTVESQVHRELMSGLSMPVGIKNRTDGDVGVAIDAILAARHSHWFPSITKEGAPAILQSSGNDQCYLVLRGGRVSGPNYEAEALSAACAQLRAAGLPEAVIIDCSHGNSGKIYSRQATVTQAVVRHLAAGVRSIRGLMLESHLVAGAQALVPGQALVYGQSITDACLSLEQTLPLLENLAEVMARRPT